MNQSIFALAALVSAMVFSFAQQQTVIESEVRRIDQFYTSRSSREAVRLLDRLEALPFDPSGTVKNPDSLTLETDLDGGAVLSDLTMLNDAAALEDETIENPDSLDLYVSGEVRYVEPVQDGSFEVAQDPTFYKEVIVTVRADTTDAADTRAAVTVSRIYSFVPTI